jgi:hypothetical protein
MKDVGYALTVLVGMIGVIGLFFTFVVFFMFIIIQLRDFIDANKDKKGGE